MDIRIVFGLQLLLSIVLYSLLAKWFVSPWLKGKTQRESLFWLTLPHTTRHVGLVFLVPGVVSEVGPRSFAVFAAYGDLAAGVLALLAIIALRKRWAGTTALVWFFNVVGTVDLLNALRHAEAVPHLQAAWYIPTFWVPALLVTHFLIFHRLIRKATTRTAQQPCQAPELGAPLENSP